MFGILPINKPAGISSRAAVDIVKKIIRPIKIGHTGTLDPLASGVLVLCIGPATRLAKYVQALPKSYIGDFQLGVTSPSDDVETESSPVSNALPVSKKQLEAALPEFIGEIQQVPPAFSAVKIGGRRAYKLSRAGQDVEITPRPVTIHSISLQEFEYPDFKLNINCGSGTYIRSLGRDIGASLNSGAVMTGLIRDAVGSFTIDNAVRVDALNEETISKSLDSPLDLFADYTKVKLSESQTIQLKNGHLFSHDEIGTSPESHHVVAVDENGNLLSIMEHINESSMKPAINFVHYFLK